MPSDALSPRAIRDDPGSHPAARAWRQAGGDRDPLEIRVLRRRRKQVYWLGGAGPDAGPIIAKRAKRRTAELEHKVYTEVLPDLPVPALGYHGVIEDDGGFCWTFLEFASGEEYSPTRAEHRQIAGEWLGLVHAAAARLPRVAELSDRGFDHFFARLQLARKAAAAQLEAASAPDDVALLQHTIRALEVLKGRWDDVRQASDTPSTTLVHGDFAPTNLRVHRRAHGASLQVFDWGESGCGSPAIDLTQAADPRFSADAALDAYRRGFSACGPPPEIETLKRLAAVGKVIRSVSAVWWGTRKPGYFRGYKLLAYLDWMGQGMRELGLNPGAAATSRSRC